MLTTIVAGYLASHVIISLGFLQGQDASTGGTSTLLMVFIGIVAFAMLAQAVVSVMLGIGAMKTRKEVMAHLEEFKGKALPLIASSHHLVHELTPKIKEISDKINAITAHVESISAMAKDKAEEFSPTLSAVNMSVYEATETANDVNRKARVQVNRVHGMVGAFLDATTRLGVAVEKGITQPGREVAGILSGVKAGLETLIGGARAFGAGRPVGGSGEFRATPATRIYPRTSTSAGTFVRTPDEVNRDL